MSVPTILSISPNRGNILGNLTVTISGTDFVINSTSVKIGLNFATNVTVLSSTLLTCKTVSHIPGTYDVEVTTPDGDAELSNAFTYGPPSRVPNIRVTNLLADRQFLIDWNVAEDNNIVKYGIYRAETQYDGFSKVAETAVAYTQYVDRVPFTFGVNYYYKVTAINQYGNETELEQITAVSDISFNDFEEQPFPVTSLSSDFLFSQEVVGSIDSINKLFRTQSAYRSGLLAVYKNGVLQIRGADYQETSPDSFTFTEAPILSINGTEIIADSILVQYIKR